MKKNNGNYMGYEVKAHKDWIFDRSWFVGIVDGGSPGCFGVSVIKNSTINSGYQIQPEFVVVQRRIVAM